MRRYNLSTNTLFAALLIQMCSCAASGPTAEQVAAERFESDYELIPNETGQYVLCLKSLNPSPSALNPENPLQFFIYSNERKGVVFEDRIMDGSVVWKGTFTLLVTENPGTVSIDPNERTGGYMLDVRTGKSLNPIR